MDKTRIKRHFFAITLGFVTYPGYTAVIQYFHSNTYTNPANFSLTKDMQFLMGAIGNNVNVQFKGQVFGQSGEAYSDQTYFLPYFAFAKRLNPKWTLALNISQPIGAAIAFPVDSVVANLVTDDFFFATDINPLLSYQVTDSLSIGAGPVVQDYYKGEINYVSPEIGHVVNRSKPKENWVWGWDAGLNWTIDKTTFLGIAYFSRMNVLYHGTSVSAFAINHHYRIDDFPTPGTVRLDFTKFLTEKWIASLTLFHTQWHDVQVTRLVNALPTDLDFPVHYHNTIALGLYSHYQLSDKWGLMGLLVFDEAATKGQGVTVPFPTSNIYGFRVGFDYALNKEITVNVKYGYFAANATIDHSLGFNVTGHEPVRVNSVDLNVTYKV